MKENWLPIKGYEDHYEVSDMGRVRSVDRTITHSHWGKVKKRGKIRKLQLSHKGYSMVILRMGGTHKGIAVHRLVASAFIVNPDNKSQVNHKNGIKSDNRAENLEWATQSENTIHSFQHGLQKIISGKKHHNSKPVMQLDLSGSILNEFDNAVIAEEKTGVSRWLIGRVCLNKQTSTNGFVWRFKPQS